VSATPLFSEADFYEGDPIDPDRDRPTPTEVVATLTRTDRELRVSRLVEQAHGILNDAIAEHAGNRNVTAEAILFSGGNDSTTLAHIFKDRATHAIHANTTIGIEQTRQFVRDTCEMWELPLIERVAPESYRELVIKHGFPGPAMHFKMYQRLKERCLDAARHELGVANSRTDVAVFLGGIRRAESRRRKDREASHRDGSVIWVSPIINWTKLDLNTYRLMNPGIPRNAASDTLHMSGECLCGAFAHRGELDEIGHWYPEVRAEIEALEAEVRAAGHAEPFCTWGHGQGKPAEQVGPMCTSCDARFVPGQTSLDFDQATS
jgi:3'-phosphoadenosine 5'-phosphosulfate sulfotransferase (PAPS reductase)/FAD synthetase